MGSVSKSSKEPVGAGLLTLRSEALDWVDVEGEIVVLDSEQAVYLAPNSSGAVLWRLLTHGTTRVEMKAALVKDFGITPESAGHDVDVFLDRLQGLGLLAPRDG